VVAPATTPQQQPNPLGVGRTITSFVSGATAATSAIASFVGVATLDGLIREMNACDSYVREIASLRTELAAEAPADRLLAQMDDIVTSCSGLNSRNITDVRGRMIATGVISATGAVTGTAGGIVSAVAGSSSGPQGNRGTPGQNIATTVLTGATAATGVASTVLSGTVLSGLQRNADVAARCASAF
jgi:glycerol-3-phosphate dehydrogenase